MSADEFVNAAEEQILRHCTYEDLNWDKFKRGIRKKRNNILDSFAPALLNYRGAGSGILRALEAHPHIDFINDAEAEQFTVIIHRPEEKRSASHNGG